MADATVKVRANCSCLGLLTGDEVVLPDTPLVRAHIKTQRLSLLSEPVVEAPAKVSTAASKKRASKAEAEAPAEEVAAPAASGGDGDRSRSTTEDDKG